MGQSSGYPMMSAVLQSSHLISIIPILSNFKTVWCSSEVYEEGFISLFQHFTKDLPKAALAHLVCTTENDEPRKEGKLTIYIQVLIQFLATYASANVIADGEV